MFTYFFEIIFNNLYYKENIFKNKFIILSYILRVIFIFLIYTNIVQIF